MEQAITKPQLCVLIRGDVELWIDASQKDHVQAALAAEQTRFMQIAGQTINKLEVVGIFTPAYMEERTRRRNGQWRCEKGTWHERHAQCHCRDYKETVRATVRETGEVIEYRR